MVGILLVGVLWGSATTGTAIALQSLNAWDISLLRAVLASAVLLLFIRDFSFLKMSRTEFLKIFTLSLSGVSLFWIFMTVSLLYSTPITVSLLVNTSPLLIVILAHRFLSEPLTGPKTIGVLLGVAGAYVVVSGGQVFTVFSSQTLVGDILALATAGCWTVYMLLYRKYGSRISLTPSQVTANIFIISVLTLLPVDLAVSKPLPNLFNASLESLLATLWLGAVSSGLGFIVLNRCLVFLDASTAAVNLMVIPVSAIIIANVVLGEEITFYKAVGGLLIILGIAVVVLFRRSRFKE